MFDSFLIRDIERIGESIGRGEDVGRALANYLSSSIPKRLDLDERAVQQAILSPANLPIGRWPTNPDHHLSLMQQCAVNLVASELSESGLFWPGSSAGVRFVQLKQANCLGTAGKIKHKEESEWNLDNLVFVMVKFHPSLMRE